MSVIGITGGISTGKTSFCDCLREIVPAAKFFNADQAARELTQHDAEVKELLRQHPSASWKMSVRGGGLNARQDRCAAADARILLARALLRQEQNRESRK